MNATRKVKLKDLTENLTCSLCNGYFIDASTIAECLHSFCRTCIVKHVEKSEFCPVCEVKLHSSQPLTSVRSDHMLQEIVYKLVPGLWENEMAKRRQFYKDNPNSVPSCQQDSGHVYNESYISSDDQIQLSLEYFTNDFKLRESSKRYVKCPAAVSISILKKLIYGKYDLNSNVQVNVMYGDRILPDDFLLMDIAYKYSWTPNGKKPLQLCYVVQGEEPLTKNMMPPKLDSRQLTNKSSPSINTLVKRRLSLKLKENNIGPSPVKIENQRKSLSKKETLIPKESTPKKVVERTPRKRKTISAESGAHLSKVSKPEGFPEEKANVRNPEICTLKGEIQEDSPTTTTSPGTEFQLRISENGVIRAKSVTSGEEKVIHLPKNPLKSQSFPSNGENPSPPLVFFDSSIAGEKLMLGEANRAKLSESSELSPTMRDVPICNGVPQQKMKQVKKKTDSGPKKPRVKKLKNNESVNGNSPHFYKEINIGTETLNKDKNSPHVPNQQNGNHYPVHINIPSPLNKFSRPDPGTTSNIHTKVGRNGDIHAPFLKNGTDTPYKNVNGSTAKKSPKFFKTRHANGETKGSNTSTPPKLNGHKNGNVSNGFEVKKLDLNPNQPPPVTKESHNNTGTGLQALSPTAAAHLFNILNPGLRLPNGNGFANIMNLGIPGVGFPGNLVPFLTSNYCSMPGIGMNFPRTTANATTAYSHQSLPTMPIMFPFPYHNPTTQHLNQEQPTLDLSTKKPTSNYVNITPRKLTNGNEESQKEPLSLKISPSPPKRPIVQAPSSPVSKKIARDITKSPSPKPSFQKSPSPEKLKKLNGDTIENTNNNNEEVKGLHIDARHDEISISSNDKKSDSMEVSESELNKRQVPPKSPTNSTNNNESDEATDIRTKISCTVDDDNNTISGTDKDDRNTDSPSDDNKLVIVSPTPTPTPSA